jgi:hypothetical protein
MVVNKLDPHSGIYIYTYTYIYIYIHVYVSNVFAFTEFIHDVYTIIYQANGIYSF